MISPTIPEKLLEVIPTGSTVLELGTGYGTERLAKHFKVISIEDNPEWFQGHSKLYHVPLIKVPAPKSIRKRFPEFEEWYDPSVLTPILESIEYDAILVDGPATPSRRPGFYMHRELWRRVPVIFDDANRRHDMNTAILWARYIDASEFQVYDFKAKKQFARVLP